MSNDKAISDHYLHGDLLADIQDAIVKLGKTIENVTIEDLAPVDEFHIGGRQATESFLGQIEFSEQGHVLDVGCGLGGTARFVASKYNNYVTGVDLTPEYIETGKVLCRWVKLDERITLRRENALSMSFQNEIFDGGYMMHVGMNIADKARLFAEVFRVLRPGSPFGVYDVMRIKDGELAYPVPWATESSTSALATPDQYRQALSEAGFKVAEENNRRDFALNYFQALRAKTEASGGPPPLGLHILMKESRVEKVKNMIENITANYIAPVEIIARKS